MPTNAEERTAKLHSLALDTVAAADKVDKLLSVMIHEYGDFFSRARLRELRLRDRDNQRLVAILERVVDGSK